MFVLPAQVLSGLQANTARLKVSLDIEQPAGSSPAAYIDPHDNAAISNTTNILLVNLLLHTLSSLHGVNSEFLSSFLGRAQPGPPGLNLDPYRIRPSLQSSVLSILLSSARAITWPSRIQAARAVGARARSK